MIDEEVETVLREIRERVIAQPLAEPSPAANGNQSSQLIALGETSPRSTEALARLNAHLTTTARAWDRLPPVFSNRTGTPGRIEVWIKARLKRFSRWFTWEQINFNAAVHHALGETLKTVTEQDAAIAAQSMQLAAARTEHEALRLEIQTQSDEIDALRAQLQAHTAASRIDLQNQQRETNTLRAELRGELEGVRIQAADQAAEVRATIEAGKSEAVVLLAELSGELRDIENEQRVCFKQLSLETSEAVVSNERAQQRTNALLEEMKQRLKQLEESAKR
jgi:hypothetical protein